jgi:hypothetical protein
MEQTTDPITTNDGPGPYQVILRPVDQGIPKALVVPFAMPGMTRVSRQPRYGP